MPHYVSTTVSAGFCWSVTRATLMPLVKCCQLAKFAITHGSRSVDRDISSPVLFTDLVPEYRGCPVHLRGARPSVPRHMYKYLALGCLDFIELRVLC